ECPTWLGMLDRCLEGDAERIALAQEWAGYCLTRNTDAQQFLIAFGDGGNGKSAFGAGLTAMLGEGNVSHVGLEAFGERFGLMPPVGKLITLTDGLGELDRCAEGKLKWFTAGSQVTIDRKGIAPLEVVPTAKLMFNTNAPPKFSDRTDGVWRRLILMPFRVKI